MMDRDMKRGMLNIVSRLIMVSGMKTANALLVLSAINGEKERNEEMKEASEAVDLIVKTIEKWNEGKSVETARLLEMQFSILRLMIGSGFDDLTAFARIEKEAKSFIAENEMKGESK